MTGSRLIVVVCWWTLFSPESVRSEVISRGYESRGIYQSTKLEILPQNCDSFSLFHLIVKQRGCEFMGLEVFLVPAEKHYCELTTNVDGSISNAKPSLQKYFYQGNYLIFHL